MMTREDINDALDKKLLEHSRNIPQQSHFVQLTILQVLLDIRELLINKQKDWCRPAASGQCSLPPPSSSG
jgi:hypothetical protein